MKMHEPHQKHGVFCIFRLIISLIFLGILSLIGEPVAANNLAIGNVDLAVEKTNLSFTGKNLKAGNKTTLKAVVWNIGSEKATNVTVRFLVDDEKVYEKKLSSLSANGKYTVSYTYSIAQNKEGDFVFRTEIDPYRLISESNKGNNSAEIKVPVKPLVIDVMLSAADLSSSSTKPKPGVKTTLKAVVHNAGADKVYNVPVRLLVDGKQVYEKKLSSLSGGGKYTLSYSYSIPPDTVDSFSFTAVADPDNTIRESDEKNNSAETTIPVAVASRNLIMDTFKPSTANPKPGQGINWQVKIKNAGETAITNVKLALYLEAGSPKPTSTLVIPSINKGASVTKNISWTVPANLSPAAKYPVLAIVDPDNAIAETNKADNSKGYNLSLTVPNLSLKPDPSYPAMNLKGIVYPGTFPQLFFLVTNDNVVSVSNVKVGLYYAQGSLSSPRTKMAETTLNLSKKGSVPHLFDFHDALIPSTTPVGTKAYVFIVVDPENAVCESDETNNEIVLEWAVVARPPQAVYPWLNIAVYDEEGNPTSAVVNLDIASPPMHLTKTAGSDALINNSPGAVIFDNLPSSSVQAQITVSKSGYRTQTVTFTYDRTDPESASRTFDLDKRAALSGTVKNQAGKPLTSVSVKVQGTSLEAVTDASGRYGFSLNGGTYTLRFVASGYERIIESNVSISPATTLTLDKTMSTTNKAYVSATVTNDEGIGLGNVDVYINGTLVGYTNVNGLFVFNNMTGGTRTFKFKKPGYVETQFNQTFEAGQEYNMAFEMFKPQTANHIERGTQIVSWHQHEATPANAFFVNEYQVDVWWGIGRVKMSLDLNNSGNDATLTKLVISNHGLSWEAHKVEGEASIETSAIDIPITIAAGGSSDKQTQMDVYKVAIESDGHEIWSDSNFWTSASDINNTGTKTFNLGKSSGNLE